MNKGTIGLWLSAALLAPDVGGAQEPAAPAAAATETGTVVFFREKKMIGAAIRYKVRENAEELCKLGSGTFCSVQASAGTHRYDVHTEASDQLTIDVKPGQIYYVVGAISMGAFAGHPKLTVTDKATFDGMKAKLKDNTGKDLKSGDDK
ncbi:MAG: hypothetical protein ABI769_14540 [Pseudomonadota bacterium]